MRRELEAAAHERRGRAAECAVERGAERAARELRQPADRRHHPHLREVERAGHHRDRGDRQRGCPATASRVMMPPRHQPTGWTGAPPASSDTARTAVGITSSTQCSRPSARSLNEIGAVVHEVGGIAERGEVLGQRAAAAQVEAGGGRGERRHQQHRRAVGAGAAARAVAVHRALGPLVDDRGGRARQVGHAGAHAAGPSRSRPSR